MRQIKTERDRKGTGRALQMGREKERGRGSVDSERQRGREETDRT